MISGRVDVSIPEQEHRSRVPAIRHEDVRRRDESDRRRASGFSADSRQTKLGVEVQKDSLDSQDAFLHLRGFVLGSGFPAVQQELPDLPPRQ